MCIVIDINTLAPVFNEQCATHNEFHSVKDWILAGRGFLVFDGTHYKEELKKTSRYLELIKQMKIAGQAVAICDELVNAEETRVIASTQGTDCDDQHIIALLGTARCPFCCSNDSRSYKHITNRSLYPKGMAKARIYSSKRNSKLLTPVSRDQLKNQA